MISFFPKLLCVTQYSYTLEVGTLISSVEVKIFLKK